VRPAGGAHPVSVWVLTPKCSDGDTILSKEHRGPDSLWSLKIPGCSLKKSRGVIPASWPNLPNGLCPSWPPNHPHILIGFITVSSPPVSWCVVGVLAQNGCRRIIQVDAAHRWWLRRFPLQYKGQRKQCREKRYINLMNYYYCY